MAEIDTPEKAQPYGQKSKEILSALIFNEQVIVKQQDMDRYGRIVARVYCRDTDINAEMIRQGAAWVYRQYAKDQTLYTIEEEAKNAGKGLWSLPKAQQVPPWEWRRQSVEASKPIERNDRKTTPKKKAYDCGAKRYCKEMSSCEEARYYLEHCGLSRLDGDNDGTPCESLCK